MKKIGITLMITGMLFAFSADADAKWRFRDTRSFDGYNTTNKQFYPKKSDNTVGAPLDGGLLALLFGAGAAYVGAKKRKALKG